MGYNNRFDISSGNFRRSDEGVFPATPDVTTRNFALPGESIHNPVEFAFPVSTGSSVVSEAIARSTLVLGTLDDITDIERRDAILAVLNEDPDYFNAVSHGLEVSGFGVGLDGLEQDEESEEFDGTDSDRAFSDFGDDKIYAEANGLGSCLDLDTVYTGTKATGARLTNKLAAVQRERAEHGLVDILRGPSGRKRNKDGRERRPRRVSRVTTHRKAKR